MRIFKRTIAYLILMTFILQIGMFNSAYAISNLPIQPAPTGLKVEPIPQDDGTVQPAVGYNQFDGYYVDLNWEPLQRPTGIVPNAQYLNFYLGEITKPYKPAKPIELKEKDISGTAVNLRMKGLNSGTIYYINAAAYYTYNDGITQFTSDLSAASNQVKVLTDIELNAYSYGTNQIKLEWDDVWNVGRRIDYKLYVSENSSFTNTQPIYIGQSQIEPSGPITINQATGKLEYIHNVRDSGRVYYVKIVPDIADSEIVMSPESRVVPVSSYILVKTTKMYTTDTGTIWKLSWSPIITGLNENDIKVVYQVDKYVNNVPIPMLSEEGTDTFISVPAGEESNYYIIRGIVTKSGIPLYPSDVKIVSDKILVKDQETPTTPTAPEIVDRLNDSLGEPIISYNDIIENDQIVKKGELTPNSATILWRVPKKADGSIDTDVVYDIWLTADPNLLDDLPYNTKIGNSLKMDSSNYVYDGTKLIGYKYVLNNLTSNATYYFKIIAKKSYVDFNADNILQSIEYKSQSVIKVVITPTTGPIDQPVVPARPPFKVRVLPDGEIGVTKTDITVQLKNMWYEKFDTILGQWEYVRTDKLNATDNTVPYDPVAYPPDGKTYRKVEYDSGVTIDVGCIEYADGDVLPNLNTTPADKIKGISVESNDSTEDRTLNSDYLKHNINITLNNLEPNTSYLIWIRASRNSVGLTSGPSDPLIVTTDPDITEHIEKPVVPVLNYAYSGDNFADLGWDFVNGYNYYIRYGTEDDINIAGTSLKVTYQDLIDADLNYYKITNLNQNTVYYFWIQAEAVIGGLTSQSEWSDSYPIKTTPFLPPATPKGFGIKSAEGSITKNSLIFEWLREEKLQYIIEISSNIDYKDLKQYNVGNISEYKVEGLLSNFRYYARIYAYDEDENLRSEPTVSITVRTERSLDDYDSDQDIENVITGDFIVKDTVSVKGIWNIKITGANADRFIEHVINDNLLDYKIDIDNAPIGTNMAKITIGNKVFEALTEVKENLIIDTGSIQFVFRPNALNNELLSTPSRKMVNFDYVITVSTTNIPSSSNDENMDFKTKSTKITIGGYNGSNLISVNKLNRPLRVVMPYSGEDWYKVGNTAGYVYKPSTEKWEKLPTKQSYDYDNNEGYISYDTVLPGDMAIADTSLNYFDDIDVNRYEAEIIKVSSVYTLNSITGRMFEPDKKAKLSDVVKFIFDVYDYNYKNKNYMNAAAKAGIIDYNEAKTPNSSCSREKAVSMTVRLFELKTKTKAKASNAYTVKFWDMKNVNKKLLPRVKFAIENEITKGRNSINFGPKDVITRGEVMFILERTLVLCGEIEEIE